MPGTRKHHTDKFRRCIEQVTAKGHEESSAYAICTTSLQNAGESIFETLAAGSEDEIRALGDFDGHPFRGNQHSEGAGGGANDRADRDEKYNAQYAEHAATRAERADALTEDAKSIQDYEGAAEAHADAVMAHEEAETAYRGSGNTEKADYHAKQKEHHDKQDRILTRKAREMKRQGRDLAEYKHLHLLGAIGTVRRERLNDRDYLVVPVIALMEGVIHAVNADTPEYVGSEVLRKAAASWIGKPVTLGHPSRGGKECSASDPEVRKSAGIGHIWRSEFDGKRLAMEAWVDEERAKKLHPTMYEALASGGREEVSVGAHVVTIPRGGAYNGKSYKATWLETRGDHLAFLPGGRGACSCEMGCGTFRAAGEAPVAHLVTAEGVELVVEPTTEQEIAPTILASKNKDCPMCQGTGSKDGNPCEACSGNGKLKTAERIRHEGGKYALYSSDGKKKLAEHFTRRDAEDHLHALDARLARVGA